MADEELRFNALNHVFVPFHEVVDDAELKGVLAHYGIVKEQLPKIRDDDPAARVIGATAGQVVKVTRQSPTAGQHVAYRLVVQSF